MKKTKSRFSKNKFFVSNFRISLFSVGNSLRFNYFEIARTKFLLFSTFESLLIKSTSARLGVLINPVTPIYIKDIVKIIVKIKSPREKFLLHSVNKIL